MRAIAAVHTVCGAVRDRLSGDPLTDEIVDPVGGVADLAAGILRHTSDRFGEDNLRVLRGAQFGGAFTTEADGIDYLRRILG